MITIAEFHVFAYTFLLCFVAGTVIMVHLWKRNLRESVWEMVEITEILENHKTIEERDARLAALLKMTQEELKIELQQHDRIELVAKKTASVTARLKATFPIDYDR